MKVNPFYKFRPSQSELKDNKAIREQAEKIKKAKKDEKKRLKKSKKGDKSDKNGKNLTGKKVLHQFENISDDEREVLNDPEMNGLIDEIGGGNGDRNGDGNGDGNGDENGDESDSEMSNMIDQILDHESPAVSLGRDERTNFEDLRVRVLFVFDNFSRLGFVF